MAKVSFTKLGLVKNQDTKTIKYNGQEIEVKQYLPTNEKLELISNAINLSADENNFVNMVKISAMVTVQIMYHYTNINFTEKQKEDPVKLFDLIEGSGFDDIIFEAIPEEELNKIFDGTAKIAKALYKYKNSALGILESVSQDYSNLDLDATKIQKSISDPENLKLLKDIMSRLG